MHKLKLKIVEANNLSLKKDKHKRVTVLFCHTVFWMTQASLKKPTKQHAFGLIIVYRSD